MVAERTLLQLAVADAVRGRTFGTAATINGLLLLAGTALAGWLGEVSGPVPLLLGAALLYLLAGGLAGAALRRVGQAVIRPVIQAPRRDHPIQPVD